MELTEDIVKDAFTHLLDEDWSFILDENYRLIRENIDSIGEKGSTPNRAIKNYLDSQRYRDALDNRDFKCFKYTNIHLKKNNRNLVNFKYFKNVNNYLIGGLSSLCDELGIEEEEVEVITSIHDYRIEIKKEFFKVRNLLKFSEITRTFNKEYNDVASIGLYGYSINLNLYNIFNLLKKEVGISSGNDLLSKNAIEFYEKVIKEVEENFTIEEKENSLYLQPKFEFIVYDK